MGKTGRGTGKEQTGAGPRYLALKAFAREALWDTVMLSGLAFVEEELEAERSALCGPRYAHLAEREALPAGHVASSLTLGGRRAEVKRPRVRSLDGHELSLPSWQAWSARDPLDERAPEQMVPGVASRRYARSLEPLPGEIATRGVSKSTVSERFVVGTAKKLAALMQRKLCGLKLLAVMIDGVRFAERVVLAAVGIDPGGRKHVLGLREEATENAAACKALPERMRAGVRGAICQAYATRDAKRARQMLENLARSLERNHPGAAASLREGLDETLTVMGWELPESQERGLSSTHLIENLFSRAREMARRVRRWQGGEMILRWTGAHGPWSAVTALLFPIDRISERKAPA